MIYLKLCNHTYIYMYITAHYTTVKQLVSFLRTYNLSNEIYVFASKIWFFRSKIWLAPRTLVICFENIICSFGYMICLKKVNYLLRNMICSFKNIIYSKKIRGAMAMEGTSRTMEGRKPGNRGARGPEAREGQGPNINIYIYIYIGSGPLWQVTCPQPLVVVVGTQ